MTSRRLVPVLVLLLALTGCSWFSQGADARDAAEKLAKALAAGDISKIPFVGSADQEGPPAGPAAYKKLIEPFDKDALTVTVDQVTRSGDTADVRLAWAVKVDGFTWKHTTHATLEKHIDAWATAWKPAIVESSLSEGDRLRVSGIAPARGRILGAGDVPLVKLRPVVRFGIDKLLMKPAEYAPNARRLALLLDLDPAQYVKQVRAAGPKAFVEAIVLRLPQAQPYLDRMTAIFGARALSGERPLAPSKEFAAAIIGTVGPATAEAIKKSDGRLRAGDLTGLSGLQARYDEQLFGTRGVRIERVPAKGSAVDVFRADAVDGTDLRTTLDPRLQQKADGLLREIGPASALVAIKPSTGEILAAASGPGSNGYNTATYGQYAPGSTFKVISSLALIRAGVTPATRIDCPLETRVNGKRFANYSDYPGDRLGRITLTQAVANSCNTAFIGQRAKVKAGALADAAAALGLGVDHDLGFPAYFGQVPRPASETEAAADLIGQGKILASPMVMATVAASVARGATVLPELLPDHEGAATEPPAPLTGSEAAQLRGLMHAVVTEGSGRFLQALQPPDVLAKTGTAEYGTTVPLPTHAWMIAVRGDLAVAVFVGTGQSGSRTAGPILEVFLRAAG